MAKISQKIWFSLCVVALTVCLSGLTFAQSDVWQPEDLTSREKTRLRYFPDVELITQDGKRVRFYDDLLKDKIVVINFFYATCDGICPGITANLLKVKKLLGPRVGKDIFFYSFTLKPQADTPEVLRHYAEVNKLGPGWTLLTGTPETLELLRQKLGYVDPDPEVDKDKSQHIGTVRFGNEPLQLWTASPGMSRAEGLVRVISRVDWPDEQTKLLYQPAQPVTPVTVAPTSKTRRVSRKRGK